MTLDSAGSFWAGVRRLEVDRVRGSCRLNRLFARAVADARVEDEAGSVSREPRYDSGKVWWLSRRELWKRGAGGELKSDRV